MKNSSRHMKLTWARYESSFANEYVRNNKANNTKNLRCFPECSPIGHRARCFCGSSVSAKFSVQVSKEVLANLVQHSRRPLFVARFVCLKKRGGDRGKVKTSGKKSAPP